MEQGPLVIDLGSDDMPPAWCTIETNDQVTAPHMDTDGEVLEYYINLKPKYPYEHVLIDDGYTMSEDGKYYVDETENPVVTLDEIQRLTDDMISFDGADGWRQRHEERLLKL